MPVRSCIILLLSWFINASLLGQVQPARLDTVKHYSSETSSLALWSSKKEIYQGECTTVTLAFLVRDDNLLRLRFHNLGEQFYRLYATNLQRPDAFVVSNNIVNIQGHDTVINNKDYTVYKIFEGAYCPRSAEPFKFPALKLNMAVVKTDIDKVEGLLEYQSAPLHISVRPLPAIGIDTFHEYKMVGSFSLHERVLETELLAGQPFTYELKIKGVGLLFPVEPPRPQRMHLKTTLVDMADDDTIINGVLHSEKTFWYWMTPETEGTHDLKNLFSFSFFDPITKRRETIASSLKVDVSQTSEELPPMPSPDLFFSRDNFILIDASQSMMIEDYLPSRLSMVREGVKRFLLNRRTCDVGVITFAGEARHIDLSLADSCYSRAQFRHITYLPKRGTAIGDALWFAQVSAKAGTKAKKIILIGDGDNTAGILTTTYAAGMAKQHDIQIFTIGVGNTGPVPFGRDSAGVPYMIDNTFSDREFKMISRMTGGEYYHPQNAEELAKALTEILGNQ